MTLLPVVFRELRVASRRRWTYWGRAVAAGVAMVGGGWVLFAGDAVGVRELGPILFQVTTFFAAMYASLAGALFCADSVAVERREGTLGLLFLTDLKGYDVLLGKMAASGLGALFYMGSAVPVIALAILMGGVGGGEYARMILLLLVLLWASLCLGMLASTWSKDGKRATGLAFGLVGLLGSVFPILGGVVAGWDGLAGWIQRQGMERPDAVRHLLALSPATAYFGAFQIEYGVHPTDYWKGVIFTGVMGWVGLVWASVRLPGLWQEKGEQGTRGGMMGWIEGKIWPGEGARRRRRTRLLEVSPLVWLTGRRWMRVVSVWLFLGMVGVAFGVGWWRVGQDWLDEAIYMTTSLVLHLVMKVWMASEAPRQFLEDRGSGGMELMLSTPMTVPEILGGQVKAMRWMFQWPVLVVLLADCVFVMAGSFGSGRTGGAEAEWVLMMISRMILLVMDGMAIVWLGMDGAMRATGTRATRWVLLKVLVLPWGIVVAVSTMVGAMQVGGTSVMGDIGFGGGVLLWLLLGVVNAVVWISLARTNLMAGFRMYGTTRPGESKRKAELAS
jgi:hypothetical protein